MKKSCRCAPMKEIDAFWLLTNRHPQMHLNKRSLTYICEMMCGRGSIHFSYFEYHVVFSVEISDMDRTSSFLSVKDLETWSKNKPNGK
jgi:hypothetical protein